MKWCDLHIHSYYSDGTFSPNKIVKTAKENGLSAVSITDHDEICAVPIAQEFGKKIGMVVISGCELSAIYKDAEIHILGYMYDENQGNLKGKLIEVREYREIRAKKILSKLEDYNINIEFNRLKEIAGKGSIGRPHIAQAMFEQGYITKYSEAFWKYIGNGKPCCVPKFRFSIQEAIDLIVDSKGIPVIAHPGNIRPREIVDELLEFPFMGIEVWHPDHNPRKVEEFIKIAQEHSLITTGGSDSHGDVPSKASIGEIKVDISVIDRLKECKKAQL
jgi:predicted metal-dependent phosphoesterase TrpH